MLREPEDSISSLGSGALIFFQKHVLLVQMNYSRFKGNWILPGGMVSAGEHPHEAAVRETHEETGLEIQTSQLLCVRHREFESDKPANVYFVFLGDLKAPPSGRTLPPLRWPKEELIEARFWPIEEALQAEEVRPHTRVYIELGKKEHRSSGLTQVRVFQNEGYSDRMYTVKT